MNYSAYYNCDVLNGEGIRSVLFVSGCSHACRGCYNQSTWSTASGSPFTEELADQIIADLKDDRIKRDGLTLTGGDPLHENNRYEVLKLILRVRKECPDKTIWLWTGYTWDEIQRSEDARMRYITKNCNVVIDGRFEQDKYDANLKWRGSSNQVIHIINLH